MMGSQSSALYTSPYEREAYTSSLAVHSAAPTPPPPCLTSDCCQSQETAEHLHLDAYSSSSLIHSGRLGPPLSSLKLTYPPQPSQCTPILRLSSSRFTSFSLSLQAFCKPGHSEPAKPLPSSQSCILTVTPPPNLFDGI